MNEIKPRKLAEDKLKVKTEEHEKNEEIERKSSPQNVLSFRHECETISESIKN